MNSVSEAVFEERVAVRLAEYGGYRYSKIGNAGDGLHSEPRRDHGLLPLQIGSTASFASFAGWSVRVIGRAPRPERTKLSLPLLEPHPARSSGISSAVSHGDYVGRVRRADTASPGPE